MKKGFVTALRFLVALCIAGAGQFTFVIGGSHSIMAGKWGLFVLFSVIGLVSWVVGLREALWFDWKKEDG